MTLVLFLWFSKLFSFIFQALRYGDSLSTRKREKFGNADCFK